LLTLILVRWGEEEPPSWSRCAVRERPAECDCCDGSADDYAIGWVV